MCTFNIAIVHEYTKQYLLFGDQIRGYDVKTLLEECRFRTPKFPRGLLFSYMAVTINPNNVLLNNKIKNWGHKDKARVIYHELVHVAQLKDMGKFKYRLKRWFVEPIVSFFKCIGHGINPFSLKNIREMRTMFGLEGEAVQLSVKYYMDRLLSNELIATR